MDINFQIDNQEDIQYLKHIDDSKKEKILQLALSIGLKSIQMSEVNMDCHSYIEPIQKLVDDSTNHHKEKLFTIESKLDDLLHIKTNSSRKGRLSEDICRDILTKTYPSWDFLDVSQVGYGADCRAFETPVGQILFEFKSYDHNVNRDQIAKFIRDLEHTNIKYGIFVSNTSGIVGKKNIEWEIINDKIVIYVSNMGMSGYGCILGTELLLSLIEINILNKDKNWILYQNIEMNELLENMSESIDDFRQNIESYTKHKVLIAEQRSKINQCIDLLEKNSFECLLNLNSTFHKMIQLTQNIQSKHTILNEFNPEIFLNSIHSEKMKHLMKQFLQCCHEYQIKSDNHNIVVLRNETVICFTKIMKSKIEILFPVTTDKINLNIHYEKIRGNEITIELKDEIKIFNILTERLKS